MPAIKASLLLQRHSTYDAGYWRRLNAFVAGGKSLLLDPVVMGEVFPKHRKEHDRVYSERCKRAIYINYTGEIIGYIVASLFQQKLEFDLDGDAELPPDYVRFANDVSMPGGKRMSLAGLLRCQAMCSLIKRTSWTLVDMPATGATVFNSRLEQERAGALNAYAVPLAPECVVDWEEDESGELLWALLYFVDSKRETLAESRSKLTHRWVYFDRNEKRTYARKMRVDEDLKEEDMIDEVSSEIHGYGRVPLVRSSVPHGLWAADILESPARGHFNHRNNLSWGETQSLLPELYEFLGPEAGGIAAMIPSEAQQNPGRATEQPRGQGYVQERGADDKAEFIGPDAAPFAQARESCKDIRDEMHRVLYQMALAADNSAASLGRSSDSKESDRASTSVILCALGQIVRDHAIDILDMVACVRRDKGLKFAVEGMTKFESINTDSMVKVAESLELVRVPSATFQRVHKKQLARAVLGDAATDEEYEAITKELQANITDEEFSKPDPEDVKMANEEPQD